MKKILCAIATCAIVFGLVGCDGLLDAEFHEQSKVFRYEYQKSGNDVPYKVSSIEINEGSDIIEVTQPSTVGGVTRFTITSLKEGIARITLKSTESAVIARNVKVEVSSLGYVYAYNIKELQHSNSTSAIASSSKWEDDPDHSINPDINGVWFSNNKASDEQLYVKGNIIYFTVPVPGTDNDYKYCSRAVIQPTDGNKADIMWDTMMYINTEKNNYYAEKIWGSYDANTWGVGKISEWDNQPFSLSGDTLKLGGVDWTKM